MTEAKILDAIRKDSGEESESSTRPQDSEALPLLTGIFTAWRQATRTIRKPSPSSAETRTVRWFCRYSEQIPSVFSIQGRPLCQSLGVVLAGALPNRGWRCLTSPTVSYHTGRNWFPDGP